MLPQEHCSNINWFLSVCQAGGFLAKDADADFSSDRNGTSSSNGNSYVDVDVCVNVKRRRGCLLSFVLRAAKINYDIMIYKISRKWRGLFSSFPSFPLPLSASLVLFLILFVFLLAIRFGEGVTRISPSYSQRSDACASVLNGNILLKDCANIWNCRKRSTAT